MRCGEQGVAGARVSMRADVSLASGRPGEVQEIAHGSIGGDGSCPEAGGSDGSWLGLPG